MKEQPFIFLWEGELGPSISTFHSFESPYIFLFFVSEMSEVPKMSEVRNFNQRKIKWNSNGNQKKWKEKKKKMKGPNSFV